MKTALPFALFSLAALATPTLAETDAQREACTPDVWRLCSSSVPNVGAITQCLHRERASLSAACRTAMGDDAPPVRAVSMSRR